MLLELGKCLQAGADLCCAVPNASPSRDGDIDLRVRSMKELSKMHGINDMQCENNRQPVFCFAVV